MLFINKFLRSFIVKERKGHEYEGDVKTLYFIFSNNEKILLVSIVI